MTGAPSTLPVADMLDAQWRVLRSWIDTIPPAALARPSVLDGLTVRDLVAHLAPGVKVLASARWGETGQVPLTIAQYVGQYEANADGIADGARSLASQRVDDLPALLDEAWAATRGWLDECLGGATGGAAARSKGLGARVVVVKRGPIRLEDLVRTRLLELVVHGDDLGRSVPELAPPAHPRTALKETVKVLLGVLVERAPGGSVEVRVPPFAAVQCIAGTSHTRGTPPNTVETDALTWIRLAAGRITWDEAQATGAARASGTRVTELAEHHLPLL